MAVVVTRHESDLGAWTHTEWKPAYDSPLFASIERIWHFNGGLDATWERVFPNGTLELIVQLDTPHQTGYKGPAPGFPLCVSGLRTTAEVIEAPSSRCCILGVRLTPPAAFSLLATPLCELVSCTIDLHDIVGDAAAELGSRVHGARDGATAVRAAAEWIVQRIARGPGADAAVKRALHGITADGGTRSIAAVYEQKGRSRARFSAAFRDCVGVSPKRFARIIRFDRALRAVGQNSAPLGEIALATGYYDQAHFTTEFREHAGLTPNAYRRSTRFPGTTSLADDMVHFFQDTTL